MQQGQAESVGGSWVFRAAARAFSLLEAATQRTLRGCALSLLASAALGEWACRVGNLGSQPPQLDGLARISGTVTVREPTGAPLMVAVLKHPAGSERSVALTETTYVDSSGYYEFAVPAGKYQIVAFEDENANQRVDDEEQGASLGPLSVQARATSPPVNLQIDGPLSGSLPKLEDRRLVVVGQMARLENSRFGPASGELGIWQPIAMMRKYRPGLYLLEEYSPKKIPVVFVHGMGGYAQEFGPLIGALPRDHFQPWLLTYASGLRLESLAQFFHDALEEVRVAYPYERLCLVAHSVGGLVARRAVSLHLGEHPQPIIRSLVTIAAPMGGIRSAADGIALSPVVVPAWVDLAPGSEFLELLYRKPLPDSVEYTLLATFRAEGADDGAIAIQSQLFGKAQAEASLVRAFVATHTGALAEPEIIGYVKRALDQCRSAPRLSAPRSEATPTTARGKP